MNLKKWWQCGPDSPRLHCEDAGCCFLSLDQAHPGCKVKVKKVAGGRSLCARMAAMGIYPGAELELLCAACGCPCLIRVQGGTVSLGAGVCQKILVTPAG